MRTIKLILLSVVILVTLLPTNNTIAGISFKITGTTEGVPEKKALLVEYLGGKFTVIDTVRLKTDGSFLLKKKIQEPILAYLKFNEKDAVPIVLENTSEIVIDIKKKNDAISYEISGKNATPTAEIQKFLKEYMHATAMLERLEYIANSMSPQEWTQQKVEQFNAEYSNYTRIRDTLKNHYLYKSSSPFVPFFIKQTFVDEAEMKMYETMLKGFSAIKPKSKYLELVDKQMQAEKEIIVGGLAADIVLPNPKDSLVSLYGLRGKVVLIDFWASWCGPCRKENPYNKVIYNKFKDKGFEIFAVSLDRTKASWTAAIESDGLPWVHVSDLKYWNCEPARKFRVKGIPSTVLLDREGRIIAKNVRGEELERFLETIFK